jgi:hypothetical protein
VREKSSKSKLRSGMYSANNNSNFPWNDLENKLGLQLISRNFGRTSCKVGWEFGNYKHEVIKLIGNRPIKFITFTSNYRNL